MAAAVKQITRQIQLIDLLLEFENKTFRALFADTGQGRQSFDVTTGDGLPQIARAGMRKDVECQFRPDAGDGEEENKEARRTRSGCWSGGNAMSRICTAGSAISASGVSCAVGMSQRSASARALGGVREAMAATGKPASR
jgi:hypothetical protein